MRHFDLSNDNMQNSKQQTAVISEMIRLTLDKDQKRTMKASPNNVMRQPEFKRS